MKAGIADALAEYEAQHEFARQVSLPVEDRIKFMPQAKWQSGYRWFRAPNVICLEKIRRLKATGTVFLHHEKCASDERQD